jgi:hypothetical protein
MNFSIESIDAPNEGLYTRGNSYSWIREKFSNLASVPVKVIEEKMIITGKCPSSSDNRTIPGYRYKSF